MDAKLSSPIIVFSLATEGPTLELWVHLRTDHGTIHSLLTRSTQTPRFVKLMLLLCYLTNELWLQ
jgi:hypothetical protein